MHQPSPFAPIVRSLLGIVLCGLLASTTQAQTWSALGSGIDGIAWEMAEYHGELYLGGNLDSPSGDNLGLLRWNGATFDTLPGTYLFGPNFIVYDLAVYNDELYFCGTMSGFHLIAKWDGTAFQAVPNNFPSTVSHLKVFQGQLYATSSSTTVSGLSANGILRWDGSQWSSVGGGISPNATIYGLEVYGNQLYALGYLNYAPDQSSSIARWDGSQWHGVGPGGVTGGASQSICTYNGELYIAGSSTMAGGVPIHGIARWNGTNWAAVTTHRTHAGQYEDLCVYHGELYASGSFVDIEGAAMNSISRYDGSAWHDVGGGTDLSSTAIDTFISPTGDTVLSSTQTITAMYEMGGELYVSGAFEKIGGVTAHRVAKWSAPVQAAAPTVAEPLHIYPNPASDRIHLLGPASQQPISLQISDLQGRLLQSQSLFASSEIDISNLSPGLYLVQISTPHQHTLKKLLIER